MTLARVSVVPWLVLAAATACQGPGGDPVDLATSGSSSGSSESPDDTPTTLAPSLDLGGGDPGTSAGESTSTGIGTSTDGVTGICGDGLVDADEGCDDGAGNGPYAACTDACQVNVCGDGKVRLGVEGCDEGSANVDTGYCKSDCQLNVCGDGDVLVGLEGCDDGPQNGEVYGGCDAACTVNRCGDGQLDVGHEERDAGPENGVEQGGEVKQVGCDLECGLAGRRVFLSSETFTGDLGTRAGADLSCQNLAEAAGFKHPERYRALLADAEADPWDYVEEDLAGRPFILPSGEIVAANWAALVADGPGGGITMTEAGVTAYERPVWTNLGPWATAYLKDQASTCAAWTAADFAKSARIGWNAPVPGDAAALTEWKSKKQWLSYQMRLCAKSPAHLYCIEAS